MSCTPVTIRNLTLGEGIPKICVPIVGTTREEILAQAAALKPLPAQLVEWRCDWYQDIFCPDAFLQTLALLRAELEELPLLLTFRTAAEGGQQPITPDTYVALLTDAVGTGMVDLLDVELFMDPSVLPNLLQVAHAAGVSVIASSHDFHQTPPAEELMARLMQMQTMGADIAKLAVMPQCPQDVLTLMEVTCTAAAQLRIPLVTMSMSGMGTISRLAGEVFGSALTFGTAGKPSAPGQLDAAKLAETLMLLHRVVCGE